MPGLVPGIQPTAGAGASGGLDPGHKGRDDRRRLGCRFDRRDPGALPLDGRHTPSRVALALM